MVALFRKLVPLEEVATVALLGREVISVVPTASHPDYHLLNAAISRTMAVNRDQEDELDQVVNEINSELQLRGVSDQHSSPPTKQSNSKLTCKELIWRRAGMHLNSPFTGRVRQEHVQLKRDALDRGLRVLKADYGSLSQDELRVALERLVGDEG